ncbi:growth-regulated alpha protein-like [Hypanus sabinus]|uniref:growth-regulated alpha protein-like n=1 Tax=Hypanus sabinus TaxID=79690 RepID=UPI0028C40DBB|nr:growth-regulated alpha protein-like [Hypanus sabinus]
MNSKFQIVILVVLVLICAYISTGSTSIVPRCLCFQTVKKVRLQNVTDFLIIPKDAHCSRTQIILTVNVENEQKEACLNPDSNQGRHLISCWQRIGYNMSRKHQCLKVQRRKN